MMFNVRAQADRNTVFTITHRPVHDFVDLGFPIWLCVLRARWRRAAQPIGAGQPGIWRQVGEQRVLFQIATRRHGTADVIRMNASMNNKVVRLRAFRKSAVW